MAATLTEVGDYLKEVYQPRIREQLNNSVKALKRIERSSTGITNETGGKYVTFPIHTRRNSGIGSRHEMGALPVPGQQGHASARIGLKYGYGGIQLTGQSLSLSDTAPKAFAKAIDVEMSGLHDDLRIDQNRQIYGSGDGAVAVVKTTATSATIAVKDARALQVGMLVDIMTGTTQTLANKEVKSISLAAGANTVTFTASLTATAGDHITRAGSGADSDGNKEITGLDAIVSASGTLYNIDPTVEPEWTSEIDDNGGSLRALSEGRMITMADRIQTRGGKTSVIFQSLGTRRAYFNLLSQQKQVVNELEFTGGFKGLAFTTDDGDIPVVSDKDAPLNTQIFLNEDDLTYYRDEEWHWLDRSGSMWQQVTDSNGTYDAWSARMVEYHELGTDRRNTHGKITDLTEA